MIEFLLWLLQGAIEFLVYEMLDPVLKLIGAGIRLVVFPIEELAVSAELGDLLASVA